MIGGLGHIHIALCRFTTATILDVYMRINTAATNPTTEAKNWDTLYTNVYLYVCRHIHVFVLACPPPRDIILGECFLAPVLLDLERSTYLR